VLGALGLWQAQRGLAERFTSGGMFDHALRVGAGYEAAVPGALWIERHIRPEIALTEAGIANQARIWLIPQQLDQALAEWQGATLATMRTAAHHHIHALKRNETLLMPSWGGQ